MKQVITVELTRKEWLQAVATYLNIPVEDIDSMNHTAMKLTIKKPLDV